MSPDGEYSVKSGYRLLSSLGASDNPSSLDISHSKKIWKAIWNMKVPNRVKILLWRAGLDALPSRMNLVKRMVNCDPICPSCGLEQETTFHALWSCSALVEVWSFCFASLIRQTRMCSNFLDIIQVCCSRSESLDMFATISSFI